MYVFAIASAKGGVGKTTTSLNLGAALASAGHSTAVVELDLPMANIVDFLDIDFDVDTDPTLHDLLAGNAMLDQVIYEAPGGFDVLPSGVSLGGFAGTDHDRIEGLVEELGRRYDVVLLDTGAGVSRETVLPLGYADGVVLVSTPRLAAVRDAKKTLELTQYVGGSVIGVVFLQSGTGKAPPPDQIADFLGVDLLGHVPEDEAVPASQDAGLPVITFHPSSAATQAFHRVVSRLGEAVQAQKQAGAGQAGNGAATADGGRDRPTGDAVNRR